MAKSGTDSLARDQEMDARYRETFQSEEGRKKRKKGITPLSAWHSADVCVRVRSGASCGDGYFSE